VGVGFVIQSADRISPGTGDIAFYVVSEGQLERVIKNRRTEPVNTCRWRRLDGQCHGRENIREALSGFRSGGRRRFEKLLYYRFSQLLHGSGCPVEQANYFGSLHGQLLSESFGGRHPPKIVQYRFPLWICSVQWPLATNTSKRATHSSSEPRTFSE
jgi:hypothetical protein